ncbi:MAG: DNA polymerase III subunit alpha, partial [Planctomycetia bacterium]|nr:DNA polymerase III subunit alpha [Planctomycetia bacterium]
MSDRSFVHLHCHSHYSLLDGAGTIDRLLARAKELEMSALALTDHGNLYGALEFYNKAKAVGVKAIVGYEAYIAPDSRKKKEARSMKEASYHLTLLSLNLEGFRNLCRLSTLAFLEGFYYRPRIDKELLEKYNEGIFCLSGCASGEISRIVQSRTPDCIDRACEVARWYQGLFGDRYCLEIQRNGLDVQEITLDGILRVSERTGIPLVATSDVHYVLRSEAEAQDILMCINTGKLRADQNRMHMDTDQFYLRSPEEMYATFPELEDAVARSAEIAELSGLELDLSKRNFPVFDPPPGKTDKVYLRELCVKGLRDRYRKEAKRWKSGQIPEIDPRSGEPVDTAELSDEVMERLHRELEVIEKLGFPSYFLIVWDFVRFARSVGIEVTARGSGVGSIVAFSLYLSHVCPLEYDLLFERFLDENRKEAPDIDIDIEQERRIEVINYVKQKYGEDATAQIGTFGTLAAKQAIKDVGRALNMPIADVAAITALVPDAPKMTIRKALDQSPELVKLIDSNPDVKQVVELARGVEGLARNVGTHAAGVVIASEPLIDLIPLQRITGKEDIATQWAMADIDKAGMLKMDFLGLKNLSMMANAVKLIEQTRGEKVNPYEFPIDDPQTYALLQRGETKGVFQLEGGGIRNLLLRMKPDRFRDIIATLALYRPGPLEGGMVDLYVDIKHGRKEAEYPHPIMKEVLEETYGVMVYQEQVMRILNRLGNIPLSDAYTCIKAISKKKLELIAKFHGEFLEGAQKNGLSGEEAEHLFGLIQKFAGYGFNKSHTTAYAKIAFITAYLKAHYPQEFMAAILTSDISARNFKVKDDLVGHLEDCARMKIEVVPPDVNHSNATFTVRDKKIIFGLSAIKGCGDSASRAIEMARERGGKFRDLFDFCERLDPSQVGRGAIESLIRAGAMDSFGAKRSQLMTVIDRALAAGLATAKNRRRGQSLLFGNDGDDDVPVVTLPDMPEWEPKVLLVREKEVLGCYLSSHPLAEHAQMLEQFCSHPTLEAKKLADRSHVILGGMINGVIFRTTKKAQEGQPNQFASFDLEDMSGVIRCNVWPRTLVECRHMVEDERIVGVIGMIDKRGGAEDEANLTVNEILPLEELPSRMIREVRILVEEERLHESGLQCLYEILRGTKGETLVTLGIDLA